MKHEPLLSFPEQAPGMTRRAMAKQRTRQRLLGAARRLFTSRGYEAATIRDIASEADLSTGAVFASFSDKADLFNEVIIADCEALFQQMAAVEDASSAAETLLNLLTLGYDQHHEQLPLIQAALGFSWVRNTEHEARYRKVLRLVLNRLAEVLRHGVERGELSPELDVQLTSEMLLDSYMANFRKAIFDDWDVETLRARLESQIAVLLAGYRAAA
jgi:AcrR family transcriptional regulator